MSDITSHAQWVSLYWSRAMSQLAAQSVADVETFQVKDFLLEFLNINRMCIEHNNKLGWTYDQQVWSSIEARIKKGESFDPAAVLTEVDQSRVTDIRNKLEKEKTKSKEEERKTKEKQERKRQYVDTRGNGYGKDSYVRDYGRVQTQDYPKGQPRDSDKPKGKGRDTPKADAKGKGRGKDGKFRK